MRQQQQQQQQHQQQHSNKCRPIGPYSTIHVWDYNYVHVSNSTIIIAQSGNLYATI